MRSRREERGLRQEEVAARARDLGLGSNRSAVAAIEAGGREVNVGQFFLLPWLTDLELPEMFSDGLESS